MPDKKITELTPLNIANSNDIFPLVDISTNETKKIKLSDLMGSPGPIGINHANNAVFTDTHISTLTLTSGTTINKFSTDGTLSGNSNSTVPTERAVKTYVDSHIVSTEHNSLVGLQGGDSTSLQFYHLTKSIYDGLFSNSPLIGLGQPSTTNLKVDYGTHNITGYISNEKQLDIDSNGLSLKFGNKVNQISTNLTLHPNSDKTLITQKAAKTYIDYKIANTYNVKRVSIDTTALVLDAILVDSTAGDVVILLDTSSNGRILVKKITTDTNKVIIKSFSGTIDGKTQYIIETPYQAYSFLIDSGDAFIF